MVSARVCFSTLVGGSPGAGAKERVLARREKVHLQAANSALGAVGTDDFVPPGGAAELTLGLEMLCGHWSFSVFSMTIGLRMFLKAENSSKFDCGFRAVGRWYTYVF